MDIESGLLAAVIAHPEDETPRLVYADWLEENGRVERAAFIRVQCRIEAIVSPNGYPNMANHPDDQRELTDLRERERLLFADSGPAGWWGNLPGQWRATIGTAPPQIESADGMRYFVRRGFVDEVRCDLGKFMLHAADLFAEHPVCEVVLKDREPFHGPHRDKSWFTSVWGGRTHDDPITLLGTPGTLPTALFTELNGETIERDGGLFYSDRSIARFPDKDAAMSALSAACVKYGRHAASSLAIA